MFYCFQPVDYLQIQQQPQHLTVVAVLSSLKHRVRHLNTIMEQMHRLVNLIPSFIQADPSGSSIYRAITGQTAPKHESGCPVGRAICLSVCVSVHPSIFITAYPFSVSCSHQLPLSLSLLPFDTRPALPSDEVHVWSAADHLCRLYFSVLTPDILSEREIERWRAGGAVCHENPGLCNL